MPAALDFPGLPPRFHAKTASFRFRDKRNFFAVRRKWKDAGFTGAGKGNSARAPELCAKFLGLPEDERKTDYASD